VAEPDAYYRQMDTGALKDYCAIGREDRESSYFLRMYLSCYRAADYLARRPDWDGRTLVVTGGSQGGQQTLVTAAIHPRVSAALANIPAGCDSAAADAGRLAGFPWAQQATADPAVAARVREAARYFDVANFAPRVTCPVLVGMGGIDTVCPAPGIYAALNRMTCPQEIVLMPAMGHMGVHEAYGARAEAWMRALLAGRDPRE